MAGVGMQLVIDLDSAGAIKGVTTLDNKFKGLKKNVRGGAATISAGAAKMSRGFSGLSRVMSRAAMIGKLALAGLAVATIITGAKFEQSMANVASVANATEQELKHLTMTARAWGKETAFSASQVAEGMYSLASAGQKTIEIQKSIGGVLYYAGAAATSMAKATETTVQALKMFNLNAGQTNKVVDVFTAGIANSMLTADRLQDSLAYVGATAYSMSMDIETTVAAIAGLHNAGMTGSMAGTKLRGVLVRLASPSARLRELMGGLTVESDGLAAVMGQLASQNMTTGETFKAFGRIAGSGALAMMQLGQEGLDVMTEKVSVAGTAMRMYEQQMNTASSQFKIFKSAMQENMIAAFMALRPLIMSSLKAMQKWANKVKPYIVGAAKALTDFVAEKKESIKAFVAMAAKGLLVAAAIIILSKAIAFTKGVVIGFTGAAQILIGTYKLIRMAVLSTKVIWIASWIKMHIAMLGPWGLLAVAVAAALVGIVMLVIKFRTQIKSVFDKVVDFFKAVGGKIKDFLSAPFNFVVDKVKWFAKTLGSIFDVMFPGVKEKLEGVFNAVKTGAGKAAGFTASAFGTGFEFVKDKAGDMAAGFSESIENMKAKIPALMAKIKGLAGGTVAMDISTSETGDAGGGEAAQKLRTEVAEAEAAIVSLADKRKAAWINTLDFEATSSRAWLNTKLEMINAEHQERLDGENLTETQIAQMRIEKDQAVFDAKYEHQRAYEAAWMASHEMQMAAIHTLEAAYDTFFMSIMDKEMTGKQRREAMWESMQRSFLGSMAKRLKKEIVMRMKNILIGQALEKGAATKSRMIDAKAGAVKAYQAFAGIPLIGPILGAAAATAAFAFLMAFHKGGSVDGLGSNEVAAVLEKKEYVIQKSAVAGVGTPALDYINHTGKLPASGGSSPSFSFNISGSGLNAEALQDWIEDNIMPQIEDGINRGAFNTIPGVVLT